jgi:hypothetical protein
MHQWLQEFCDFSLAAINNWAGYATGGAIVAFIWFWSAVRQQTVRRKFALSLAVLFLYLGCFKAWREQLSAAKQASDDVQVIQKKLDDLQVPKLVGSIDQVATAPTGEDGMQSLVTIFAHINNQGAPSVLENWHATQTLDTGQVLSGVMVPPPYTGGVVVMHSGEHDEHKNYLMASDNLGIASMPNPIPRGGGVEGWIIFVFPTEKQKTINSAITLYFNDVNGEQHSLVFKKGGHDFQPLNAEELWRQSKKARSSQDAKQKH